MERIKDNLAKIPIPLDTLATEQEDPSLKVEELKQQHELPVAKGRKHRNESKRRRQLLGVENQLATPAGKAPIAEVEHDYDKEFEEMSNRLQNAKLQSSEKKPEQF